MTHEEITRLKAGDAVRITPPRFQRRAPFTVILDRPVSRHSSGVLYLTGIRVRQDGTPDKRSRRSETHAVSAEWVAKAARL